MPAMAVILTPSFCARCFLVVLLGMAIISFRSPAASWQLSRSSTLFSSTDQGTACPGTVHPSILLTMSCRAHGCYSRRLEIGTSSDFGCGCPLRQ